MHYIYKITNILNNKVYIGQTIQPSTRWSNHKSNTKTKPIQYIHYSMAKYGIENFTFEVIGSCITEDVKEVDAIEDDIINQYQSRNSEFGYNIKPGGPSRSGFKHSEETKRKISKIKKGTQTWLGRHHSEESKNKMSQARVGKDNHQKGRKHSEESRKQMSESAKGNTSHLGHNHSEESRKKISEKNMGREAWNKGISPSEEAKIKISESKKGKIPWNKGKKGQVAWNKGKPMSDEHKKKISESKKRKLYVDGSVKELVLLYNELSSIKGK